MTRQGPKEQFAGAGSLDHLLPSESPGPACPFRVSLPPTRCPGSPPLWVRQKMTEDGLAGLAAAESVGGSRFRGDRWMREGEGRAGVFHSGCLEQSSDLILAQKV